MLVLPLLLLLNICSCIWVNRPQVYIGSQLIESYTSEPQLSFGLMWHSLSNYEVPVQKIRNMCEMNDDIKFSYQYFVFSPQCHHQEIQDGDIGLSVKYQTFGDFDFLQRVKVEQSNDDKMAFIFYGWSREDLSFQFDTEHDDHIQFNTTLGHEFRLVKPDSYISHAFKLFKLSQKQLWKSKDLLQKLYQTKIQEFLDERKQEPTLQPLPPYKFFQLEEEEDDLEEGNFFLIQLIIEGNTELDFYGLFHPIEPIKSKKHLYDSYKKDFKKTTEECHQSFIQTFNSGLGGKIEKSYEKVMQSALSNLLGGIGYFYGTALEQVPTQRSLDPLDDLLEDLITPPSKDEPNVEYTQPKSLLSGTPSRSFFPRGFLWDEGFHTWALVHFHPSLALDIFHSWFGLQDAEGWLGREQILGDEARSRVPEQFWVQSRQVGNPPTFLFMLRYLLETDHAMDVFIFEKLKKQFVWFIEIQQSPIGKWLYAWHGGSEHHLLPSGLDDYPRLPINQTSDDVASRANIDLQSWLCYFAKQMHLLTQKWKIIEEKEWFKERQENICKQLHEHFWDEKAGLYGDLLVNQQQEKFVLIRKGYLSFFPLFLDLLDTKQPDHLQRLERLLEASFEKDVQSDDGFRSLSDQDPDFETDEKYWKGAVWMNFQYLHLSALNRVLKYPLSQKIKEKVKKELKRQREGTLEVVKKEWESSGYFWEQYFEGKGRRTHPFCGWTCVFIIMTGGEIYL